MGLAFVFIVAICIYSGWIAGQVYQEDREKREEQIAQLAYHWAREHGRLPTTTYYVDTDTGEILSENHG